MLQKHRKTGLANAVQRALLPLGMAVAILPLGAQAFQFETSPDWKINWDNTLTYNLGFRAHSMDDRIGDNPNFHQSAYRFADAGDIVTNRLAVLSEFNVVYKRDMGLRLTASAWKDFAYDKRPNSNPGEFAPGLPYEDIQGYRNGRYSSHTNRFYRQGGEILDAFVFYNFDVAGKSTYLRAGQYTEYWGGALFFPFQSISYSQGAIDGIKLATAPGTETKEIFLPRKQLGVTVQLNDEWAVSGQYFFGFDANRAPDGGTYLGGADFLWQGPTDFFLVGIPQADGSFMPFSIPQTKADRPDNQNDNFGLRVMWTPASGQGALGMYYRHFDEVQPWAPWIKFDAAGNPTSYYFKHNESVDLYGLSYDTNIGNNSTSFELSYREGTALNSTAMPIVAPEKGGARGNVINAIANVIVPLSRSAFWDTGTLTAEVSYAHLLKVTDNSILYKGEDTGGCTGVGGKWSGCSTRDYVGVGIRFEPQWLQVFPGVDLSMPISDVFGVSGNSAQLSSANQGAHSYSVGLKATIYQKTTATLAYNGYYARTNQTSVTPSGKEYYSSGNGPYGMKDKGWVSLSIKSSF